MIFNRAFITVGQALTHTKHLTIVRINVESSWHVLLFIYDRFHIAHWQCLFICFDGEFNWMFWRHYYLENLLWNILFHLAAQFQFFSLLFPLHFRNNGKKTVRSYTLWLWISIWQYNVNIFLSVKMCTPLSRWYSHKLLVLFLLLRLFGYCFGACAAEVKSSWDDSNWCKSCVSFGNIITSRNDISKRKHVKGANFVCSSRGFHFLFVYFGCIRRDDAKQVVFEKDWIDRRAWWCC